ncbi:MAG TPA: large conductance mechanosensitive channel protein MscL [Acidimicrobiia bacterium]|jgi:large conductance mechanosensitive channel
MVKEFRDFINRGNLVDIAVAFVLGVAFASVVNTFTERIVYPVLGYVFNSSGLEDLGVFGKTVDGVQQGSVGAFIGAVLNFVIVALVMFLVVKAYNHVRAAAEEEAPSGPTEVQLLTEIRDSLQTRA